MAGTADKPIEERPAGGRESSDQPTPTNASTGGKFIVIVPQPSTAPTSK